jgi:NADH dehydrogenase (ubiquinone) Fe-S protein 1
MMRHGILRGLKPTARGLVNVTTRRAFTSTPRVAAEVEITIDGKKVKIEQGAALIQACEKAGITIPRYCYHVRWS